MSSLIDWNKVAELRDDVGAEDFDEVVEVFLEEVSDAIDLLGRDGRSVAADLHFLKGASSNLGFVEFAELCRQGEDAATREPGAPVDLAFIVASYRASREAFLAELEARFG